jgi:acyl-CoA thioesterase I
MLKRCVLLLAILIIASCSLSPPNQDLALHISQDSTVACVGDSLTSGYGAPQGESYPDFLQTRLSIPIVNLGIDGDTTVDALQRIRGGIVAGNAVIVIVELGANDVFQGVYSGNLNVSMIEENLRNILGILEKANRKIYVARFYTEQIAEEILLGNMSFYYQLEQIYSDLRKDYSFTYIEDIWGDIWANPNLMSDSIHPNGAGYQEMANIYYKALEPLLKYNNLLK